jgi:hypothetical protein
MKRGSILVIASLALVVLVTAKPAAGYDVSGSFVDDDGSAFESDIEAIAAFGITRGCGDRAYCPTVAVSRAQMASFLARALKLPAVSTGPFTDLGASPHAGDINAIASAGVTLGCAAGRYCPEAAVRRDEMASFLARAFRLSEASHQFTDVGANPHGGAIGAIAVAGITKGCTTTTYCPAGAVTREQMAAFMRRALGISPVFPRMSLSDGLPEHCSKDGLSCAASIAIPFRSAYRISEGVYGVVPFKATEEAALVAASTGVIVTVDGVPLPLTAQPVTVSGNLAKRTFETNLSLTPNPHRLIVQWFWQGKLTKTLTLDVAVN